MSEFIIYKQERNKMEGSQLRILRGKINPEDEDRGFHHELEQEDGVRGQKRSGGSWCGSHPRESVG